MKHENAHLAELFLGLPPFLMAFEALLAFTALLEFLFLPEPDLLLLPADLRLAVDCLLEAFSSFFF